MDIEIASPSDLPLINKYYEDISFRLSSSADLQICLKVSGKIAGLGRLVHVDSNNGELGGIYILPEYRGKKLAETLVRKLIEKNSYPVLWCIPFKPLELFYRRFGFRSPTIETVPDEIRTKVEWCQGRYPDPAVLLVMKKDKL